MSIQAFSKNDSVEAFFHLHKSKLKTDLKFCLNFSRSLISAVNKRKLKELGLSPNDFANDQKRLSLYSVVCGINRPC